MTQTEMRAIGRAEYGGAEVLRLETRPIPEIGPDMVLVRVHAVSLNASDAEFLTGRPIYARATGPFRPRISVLGSDVAGVIVATGAQVDGFGVGDAVLADNFDHWGGLAEFVAVPAARLVALPEGMSFTDAAAVPQSAAIAVQALRHRRETQSGDRVLINGAGGGAGTFAVQLAKQAGAEVTAVDHGDKLPVLATLGADHVIDYRDTDFASTGQRYDRVVDLVATRWMGQVAPSLPPDGIYSMVGGTVPLLLNGLVAGAIRSALGRKWIGILALQQEPKDIQEVAMACVEGRIKPQIHTIWPLEEAAAAFDLMISGRILGKAVLTP